ncbi:cytochrome P450 [Xylariaceae sp. FL0016]|nr:cytochrome P450 [Xylariaceae sp. FL0016]
MVLYYLFRLSALALTEIFLARLKFYPKPYPGIPFNDEAASRITGDLPDLVPLIQASNEFSSSLLLPALRKPLITLEDPREIEDILLRRNKDFDKASTAIDVFAPMFPNASISQYTTPQLRAQKRLWADVMSVEFLRKAATPNIHKATLELLELWRLKASTIYKEQPFTTHEDFKNAALDAIWVAIVGEEPGVTRYEIKKFQHQVDGRTDKLNEPTPRGAFLKEEVAYIGETIARNSNSPVPKWAQKLETYTSRYRKFRDDVTTQIGHAMEKAVDRFQRLEMGKLEAEEFDTCMMDLVLRRQVLEAKRAGKPPTDPRKDQSMLDEMFVMLVGTPWGHDSTANVLAWFVRFMEGYPVVQAELRAALRTAFPDPKVPTVQDILDTDVPYLNAVCEEGFRLAGVAKGNLRQSCVDTEILGCKIPKGAEVFMNYHINRAPVPVDESKRTVGSQAAAEKHGDGLRRQAGQDLHTFAPWLVKDDKTGKESFNAYAIPSLAFGRGYRGCASSLLLPILLKIHDSFRIVATLLILHLEFSGLPEDLKPVCATEKIFRQPDMPYARVKVL